MNLHEYQSKQLFAEYAIPVPKGGVAGSPEEAVAAAQKVGSSLWVVRCTRAAAGRPAARRAK
jgi:succinyl-CoA synthetase beta subunit